MSTEPLVLVESGWGRQVPWPWAEWESTTVSCRTRVAERPRWLCVNHGVLPTRGLGLWRHTSRGVGVTANS